MIRDPRYKHTGSSATHEEAPDGRKADWTKAQHLPEGRGAVGCARVNIGNRKTAQEDQ